MIRRTDKLAFVVACCAIAAFAVLLVFAFFRLAETEAEMRRNEGDNMLWAISQAHAAALLVDAAIAKQVGQTQTDAEIERRYNVLLSRLTLLSDGPQARYIDELGLAKSIDEARRDIIARGPDILGLSHGDIEVAAGLHEELQPLIRDLGLAGNRSMVRQWEGNGARLDRHREAITQVIISIVAIIVLGVFISVTMLRAMAGRQRFRRSLEHEQEIVEAYRSFVALVSHQFRTPLAVIDSSMQRLLRSGDSMPRAEIAKRAELVRAEVGGLTDLIGTTLNIARLEAGQVTTDPQRCEIEDLVEQIRRRQLTETPDRTVDVVIADEVPPYFETDRLLAEQILNNLISNAVKYSPSSEPVSIQVSSKNRQIHFTVTDSGVGIPEDEQEKLFKRFYRASTSEGVPGVGVGLSVALQLARLLGGDLECISHAGLGSTFVLKLPIDWPVSDGKAEG
ncbi:sensor histidine kinase [Celeribacter sp.]|uniref:sensor histidine kinase n=1 Tax=Celeribacter sp. TaxID=1890673 RepID=UPI003A9050FD